MYSYDRLGRVSYIDAKNGTAPLVELAHYEYYPTGSVKTVTLGNSLTISYTYHISGAVKTAAVISAKKDGPNPDTLYSEKLYYEDCGSSNCAQYNGNISRMKQLLAHGSNSGDRRDVTYLYDELNRLINVNDSKQDVFDEIFAYDAQGRITMQRRGANAKSSVTSGGEYSYEGGTNKLKSVANGMGGTTADERNMSDTANFVYDSEGNLVEDKSKRMKISYDWRGMPVEFRLEPTGSFSDTARLSMMYDGSGRRISKTFLTKSATAASWDTTLVTHYTGIGTEIREYKPRNFVRYTDSAGVEHCVSANPDYGGNASTACPLPDTVKAVIPLPQGLGRYALQDVGQVDENGAPQAFEWYLKNHLGSTMVVYGTGFPDPLGISPEGELRAAYDYRSFGEQLDLLVFTRKVTENFTGKEHDDETQLNYFGARYLDPMLGMWISVDPKRQFASLYLYAGNGMNPMNGVDEEGNDFMRTYWRYTPTKQYAAGFTIYYTGTPEKPGKEVGHWSSHSGGYGTAMKPGTYLVDSKNKRDVRHMNDGSRGWKSWAYVIYTENGKELRGAEGSRVMLHNDDLDPPTTETPARGTTHGCHGILDESSNSDELKPEGNLPELLKNADERMVPLIVEEF